MIAGANNAESLLFVVETQRKGEEVLSSVRKELADLGIGAKQAGEAIGKGAEAGIAEILKLSQTIDASSKKDIAALKANAQAVRELAQAAGLAPAEIQKLATAEAVLEARIKAVNQEAKASAAQIMGLGNGFDITNPKARTAANAFTSVAFAASGMTHDMRGAIVASGTLISSLGSLASSAAFAAGSNGLAAAVVTLGTLLPLLQKTGHATDFSESLATIANAKSGEEIANMVQSIETEIAREKKEIKDFLDSMGTYQTQEELQRLADLRANLAAEEKVLKAANARRFQLALEDSNDRAEVYKKLHTTIIRASQSGRESAEERAADRAEDRSLERVLQRANAAGNTAAATTIGAVNQHDEMSKRSIEEAQKIQDKLDSVILEAAYRRMGKIAEADDLAINEQYDRAVKEIKALQISEDQKTALVRSAEAARTAALEEEAAKRAAKAKQEADKELELEKAKAKRRESVIKASIDAVVRTQGSVVQTLKRLALEPIVSELEGIAAREAVKALASFPNAAAMAAHGAAAAAATGAAHEVASWEGLSTRSTSSPGQRGSSDDSQSFRPFATSQGGGGQIVINVITRNPFGKDEINSTLYEINRAGILKIPSVEAGYAARGKADVMLQYQSGYNVRHI